MISYWGPSSAAQLAGLGGEDTDEVGLKGERGGAPLEEQVEAHLEEAPLEEQVEAPLEKQTEAPLFGRELLGCFGAIGQMRSREVGDEAPLDEASLGNVVVAPLEEQGFCQLVLGS